MPLSNFLHEMSGFLLIMSVLQVSRDEVERSITSISFSIISHSYTLISLGDKTNRWTDILIMYSRKYLT